MPEPTIPVGRIRSIGAGGHEGTLQRTFEGHDCAAVWHMLTDQASLPQWLAAGTIDPRKGGKAHIDFQDSGVMIDSEVATYDPPRTLAYSWSHGGQPLRPLCWQLEDLGAATRLTLTIGTPAGEDAAKACAGFEAHLDMLAAALEGVPIKFPFDVFLQARAAYGRQLGAR